ncbi:MAG: membrane biogenesis protein [Eubacteriaceae bacterium]|nr:membrane biogenesis protein [Eubacteriaceae bacterium]
MKTCFKEDKAIIGMLHLKGDDNNDTFRRAVREFEIYRKCGVDAVMVETYFGTYSQAETMLDYLRKNADGVTYGVNCLNVDAMGFELGNEFDCDFLQIDSVIGHVKPRDEESIAAFFRLYKEKYPSLFLMGGVRFKYQPLLSERTLEEDLITATGRCDGVCVTQNATGEETDMDKIVSFKNILGDFPLYVCSGVRADNVRRQLSVADGAVVGSFFKDTFKDDGEVCEDHVNLLMNEVRSLRESLR